MADRMLPSNNIHGNRGLREIERNGGLKGSSSSHSEALMAHMVTTYNVF